MDSSEVRHVEFDPNPSVLLFHTLDVLWLQVAGEELFKASGHHPVAGRTNSRGAEEYVAQAVDAFPGEYATAIDGASSAVHRTYKRKGRASAFAVLVLRFEDLAVDKGSWPASRNGAGRLHWRKMTPKGKITYERGQWRRFYGVDGKLDYHVIAKRSADFIELWRSA